MKANKMLRLALILPFLLICLASTYAQKIAHDLTGQRVNGYKGIWFTLGQVSEYGDKYSGGLGTYTAKHVPLAIYAEEVDKTFFVYGGTTGPVQRHLLCMIGTYDHARKLVSQPVVVHDKMGVDDPHDNPSLMIDEEGYIWVFVSGRGRKRMGFKYRSSAPYSTDSFERISEEEMTYPQPWHIAGQGYFHFFTKYTGVRELYFERSKDGHEWSEDQKLSSIKEEGMEKSGHYQISNHHGNTIGTFFNWHPEGNVDRRTNLYYLQTTDMGQTWQDVSGEKMETPLSDLNSSARVFDYYSLNKNVYLKDIQFDKNGHPACLYITSGGHEPGPKNNPREWKITAWDGNEWQTSVVTTSDHNYDMGSLWVNDSEWMVIAPSLEGPQPHGGGGEITQWFSKDRGKTWKKKKTLTKESTLNHNYVRRVVNGRDPFLYFWADGNPDTLSQSHLYFGSKKGHVWQLPYDMGTAWEKPLKLKQK